MIREMTFSSGRTGLYEPCKLLLTPTGQNEIYGARKILAALISGAISAVVCNPTDVVKIKFQGDPSLKGEPRLYKSVFSAFRQIVKSEGFFGGLYKGAMTTTVRSAVLSCSQLSSYDVFKNEILVSYFPKHFHRDDFGTHLVSSIVSGVVTALTSNPFDVARTRIMNQTNNAYSKNPFKAIRKICQEEGLRALYKGFVPSYIRMGLVTCLFFLIYERVRLFMGFQTI